MGNLLPGIPSIPGDETTWGDFVTQFEALKKGDIPLSLTKWDSSTTKPSIAAGSLIEVAGAVYLFATDEDISNDSGLSSGTVYVVIRQDSPTEATPFLVNTAPIWRDDLNGWYESSGTGRYTGHLMSWDGSSGYSQKRELQRNRVNNYSGNVIVTGSTSIIGSLSVAGNVSGTKGIFSGDVSGHTFIDKSTNRTYQSVSISTTTSGLFPEGLSTGYVSFDSGYGSLDVFIEILAGSTWRTVSVSSKFQDANYYSFSENSFTILSDGANYRWRSVEHTNGIVATLHYVRSN